MSGLLVSLQGAVAQGVLWGIMVLGVYITFRLMDIADMTVDGSFALGACVCAVLVVNKGVNPVLALLVAAAAGVVAGAVTGILHTVFEIPAILAGILTQISLWVDQPPDHGRKEQSAASESQDTYQRSGCFLRDDPGTGIDDRWNCAGCGGYSVSLLVLREPEIGTAMRAPVTTRYVRRAGRGHPV